MFDEKLSTKLKNKAIPFSHFQKPPKRGYILGYAFQDFDYLCSDDNNNIHIYQKQQPKY